MSEINACFFQTLIPPKTRRKPWGEITYGWRGPVLDLACYDSDHLTLIVWLGFATVYIKVRPFLKNADPMETSYGFSFTSDGLHLHWGERTKVLWYPWGWNFHKRWELADVDGSPRWVEFPKRAGLHGPFNGDVATKETFDYSYTLRSGEVQKRKATVYADRMEWRWRCLKWLPFPRLVKTGIWVTFDDEVGERSGSWKGGVTGCGYDLRPGESAWDAFKRMERDRVFK